MCIGCTRLQAFASVLPPVHGGERGRAFSTGLAAGVSGMSHACELFFLNAYLCISRGPFVLSRFLLVPFVFSSQSDTDLANMVMESSSREKLLRELMRLGSSSLLCAMQLRYNKICWLSYILIGVFL